MKKSMLTALFAVVPSLALGAAAAAETPKRGGSLTYVVASDPPSFDAHRETTFGVVHPLAPFYSLLLRINPMNPQDASDIVCDLCESYSANDDMTQYTYNIRQGVRFHDGTPLTAHDIVATYNKIVFPPEGVPSNRRAFYQMIETITAIDDYTVVMTLKYPTLGYLPIMASPFNFIYSRKDLESRGYEWHTRNVNGTGPFQFVEFQPGAFIEGKRYGAYHHIGADGRPQPYLDGYRAIIAPKMSTRLQAIRGDRAAIEFRGFPPKARDDLVNALGDQITVQESDWNTLIGFSWNRHPQLGGKFDDVRVRRAMQLSVDRWGGSEHLSQIAIVKSVGGLAIPTHPIAATKEELQQWDGFLPDIDESRERARRLLKEAGAEGMPVTLWNRAVDQPYKVLGTWFVDQWRQIGLKADQSVVPSGPWFDGLRVRKDYEIDVSTNSMALVNPVVDASKWQSSSIASNNYNSIEDPEIDALYAKMNAETDTEKQKVLFRQFEKMILHDKVNWGPGFWWYRITPHRSYVKGWKIGPSHFLNQQLDTVWLDK